jgi:pimeloyl-ACP methyl ester carboxylesterase
MTRTVPITRAGNTHPDLVEGVVLIDPDTGLPIPAPAPAQGLTREQLDSAPVAIASTARVCLGTARATVTTSSQTLAAAISAPIPAGAVTCELQADGGTVRLRRDAVAPTTALGYRLDDGAEKMIDTPLADVRVISGGASSVFANVAFFDRV